MLYFISKSFCLADFPGLVEMAKQKKKISVLLKAFILAFYHILSILKANIANQNNIIWESIKLVKTQDLGDRLVFCFLVYNLLDL